MYLMNVCFSHYLKSLKIPASVSEVKVNILCNITNVHVLSESHDVSVTDPFGYKQRPYHTGKLLWHIYQSG
jgi:hypothetical protein